MEEEERNRKEWRRKSLTTQQIDGPCERKWGIQPTIERVVRKQMSESRVCTGVVGQTTTPIVHMAVNRRRGMGLRTWKVDWSRKLQRTTKSVAGEGAKLPAKSHSPRCASTSRYVAGPPRPMLSLMSLADPTACPARDSVATEVLAKHDEKYMPKEVATTIEKNKKQLEEAAAETPR
ncbi:hypothetical protein Fmac_010599 [Flemingia macrophylla]|uniref:Uncharacterized protein n=1 Tax=Flemingia macrophylla TaxID=520843 RepID=A0ABD1MKW6_9FABA